VGSGLPATVVSSDAHVDTRAVHEGELAEVQDDDAAHSREELVGVVGRRSRETSGAHQSDALRPPGELAGGRSECCWPSMHPRHRWCS